MIVAGTYWMWTSGTFSVTLTFNLNPTRRYLITGSLSGTSGGHYGQVFVSMVCTRTTSQVLCGIRDDPGDPPAANISSLGVVETLSNATSVTVKLRGDGGLHRAEGILFDIT
jgi:hypothetical protein